MGAGEEEVLLFELVALLSLTLLASSNSSSASVLLAP